MERRAGSGHDAPMWEQLGEIVEQTAASPWLPLVVFTFALLDSVFPVVPSEAAVIAGGVAAGIGDQSLWLVLAAALVGAFLGDCLAYWIGRSASGVLTARSQRLQERLEWAAGALKKRGTRLLITARFVPLGRTAVTLASGLTRQPWSRYAPLVGIAALIWALYAATLGFVFGEAFEGYHVVAVLGALGAALLVNAVAEMVRFAGSSR
jgi:membrane-associated protein